jgi:hypothetical protein
MLVVRPVAALAVLALAVAPTVARALAVAVAMSLAVTLVAVPVPVALMAWRRRVPVVVPVTLPVTVIGPVAVSGPGVPIGVSVAVSMAVAVAWRRGSGRLGRRRRRRSRLGSDRRRRYRCRCDRLRNARACHVPDGTAVGPRRDRMRGDRRRCRELDGRTEGDGRCRGRGGRRPARSRGRERIRAHDRRPASAGARVDGERRLGDGRAAVDDERGQVHRCENRSTERQRDHHDYENSAQLLPRFCRFTLAWYRQNRRNLHSGSR